MRLPQKKDPENLKKKDIYAILMRNTTMILAQGGQEMNKSKQTGSRSNHTKQKEKRQKQECKRRQKHWRQKQEWKKLQARRAEQEIKPTPTARGYFGQRFWKALHLNEALEKVNITKTGGVAIGCILLVIMLYCTFCVHKTRIKWIEL